MSKEIEKKIVYPVLAKSMDKGQDGVYGGVTTICSAGAITHWLECPGNTGEKFMKTTNSHVKYIEELEKEDPTLQPSIKYKQCYLSDDWHAWDDLYDTFLLNEKLNSKKKKVYPVLAKHMGPDEVDGGVTTICPAAVTTHWIKSPGSNGEKFMKKIDSNVKIIEKLEMKDPTSPPHMEYKRCFLEGDWQPWNDFYSTFMLSEVMKKMTVSENGP